MSEENIQFLIGFFGFFLVQIILMFSILLLLRLSRK